MNYDENTKVKVTYPEPTGDVIKYTTVSKLKKWLLDGGENPDWVEGVISLLKSQGRVGLRFALYEIEEGEH